MVTDNQERLAIQQAIANVISGTADTANVKTDALGYIRAQQPADFIDQYVDEASDRVQAWFIGRSQTASDSAETRQGAIPIRTRLLRNHRFEIHGFMSYESETTEPIWQALLDDIITAFNNQRSLGGWSATPIQLPEVNFEYLGSVLCHHAMMRVEVFEWVGGLTPS
jgi:hypothetical protein